MVHLSDLQQQYTENLATLQSLHEDIVKLRLDSGIQTDFEKIKSSPRVKESPKTRRVKTKLELSKEALLFISPKIGPNAKPLDFQKWIKNKAEQNPLLRSVLPPHTRNVSGLQSPLNRRSHDNKKFKSPDAKPKNIIFQEEAFGTVQTSLNNGSKWRQIC